MHFFLRFFSQHFLLALLVSCWKNCFEPFFPPIFWSRYSCEYKKTFFALFSDDFFPNIFCSHYSFVSGKIFSLVLCPPFFRHDIRVNIKKRFSQFIPKFFSQHFLLALYVCFWKNCFARFFPPILWSRYSCEYKKTF